MSPGCNCSPLYFLNNCLETLPDHCHLSKLSFGKQQEVVIYYVQMFRVWNIWWGIVPKFSSIIVKKCPKIFFFFYVSAFISHILKMQPPCCKFILIIQKGMHVIQVCTLERHIKNTAANLGEFHLISTGIVLAEFLPIIDISWICS